MGSTVTIQPGGQIVQVEEGESILDAALRQSLNLPHSCRGGSCMSCKSRLLEGAVEYPYGWPAGLTAEEADTGLSLLCQARPLGDVVVEVREVLSGTEVKRLPCRVDRLERLNHDVMALYLKLPAARPLQFRAGQYVDIILRDGRRRSFSIANPPHDSALIELHVRRVPGGEFTGRVFEDLEVRTLLRLEGPLGGFFLREDSERPALLMAGGTGFAPLKGILLHAFASGMTRPLHLYWGVRSRRDLYQHDLVQGWQSENGNFQYTPVLSEASLDRDWTGRTGLVHEALLEDYPDLSSFEVYMSGPPPMIDAARVGFERHGLRSSRLFFDSFEFAPEVQRELAQKLHTGN